MISDPLFTHLWTLSTAFDLIQVKAGFDTLIFSYLLLFLYKSGIISIIYYQYGKSFIDIIPYSASYTMSFSLTDYSYFCRSGMKNCVFILEKDLLFTRT